MAAISIYYQIFPLLLPNIYQDSLMTVALYRASYVKSGFQFSSDMNPIEYVPKLGMDFDTVDEAWEFWTDYGARTGFSPRRFYNHTSKKDGLPSNVVFVCNKEGKRREQGGSEIRKRERPETRTNCEVKFGIHRTPTSFGKYRVYVLCSEHNHLLHTSETTHMMTSQRRISDIQASEIELADASGILVKQSHKFMSKRVGGVECTGFTELDHRNFLRTRRQHDLIYGDAGSILSYFSKKAEKNPFFFYDMQLDNEEQITNIFWADARMRIDYGLFGDVVSFDTTYSTNKESRPFGVFIGLNHHRSTVIFGAAILFDETSASFEWLFKTFLNCHSQKHPRTIFTDQDAAMAKAISNVLQNTYHGLCTFHTMQNGLRHLGNLMKGGSSFLSQFHECMYGYTTEENFEAAWRTMITKFFVEENRWLLSIYKLKKKWASCYMRNVYSLGMRSTQLSESCNAELKRHLKSSFSLIRFFTTFEDIVNSKNHINLKLEYESREKLPMVTNQYSPISLQLCNIYTPAIFKLFQNEISSASAYRVICRDEKAGQYTLNSYIDGDEATVSLNVFTEDVLCSCKKFESWGFLCRHVIRVLDLCFIFNIPRKYILLRWTKDVVTHQVEDISGCDIKENIDIDVSERYRHLCPKLVRLADYASRSKEGYEFMLSQVNGLMKAVKVKEEEEHNSVISLGDSAPSMRYQGRDVKGLAKKVRNYKGDKRPRSWFENHPKKKVVGKNKPTQLSDSGYVTNGVSF